MLRLSQPKESRWVELSDFGVRIKLRPLTTAVVTAMTSEARKRVAALWAEHEDNAKAGTDADPLMATWANADYRAGRQEQFIAEALLRFGVEEWEGVGDEAGNPLPPSAEAFAAFAAHADAVKAFLSVVLAPAEAVAAEGNASAPSSPGAGDGGASTAPDAATAGVPPVH